jgi:integrase
MHTVLRRALAQAEEDGLVPRNVAAIVKPPRMTRSEMHVLSPEEARILLEAAQGDRLEALYTLALTTGMRIGELCALRFVDVDLKAQALHVRCTLRYRNQDLYFFETPKTPKSRRRIALSAITVDALRAHRTRQLEERLAAGVAWREDDLVFCDKMGVALCPEHLSGRNFQLLLKRAGLAHRPFHSLRHTCATLLLRRGVHPKVVSELLGHSTVSMTLDRYSHVLPDMQRDATAAMDTLLG